MTEQPEIIGDELFYGGGATVPVNTGDAPDEANVVSEMFFIAKGTILVAEFEGIATQPMILEGSDGKPHSYILVTCKGRINNSKELGAFTMALTPVAADNMFRMLRKLFLRTPLELRTD